MSDRHYEQGVRPVKRNRAASSDFTGLSPGRLYPGGAVLKKLHIGKNTLTAWIKDGLPVYGEGSRTDLFLGRDVIVFATKRPKTSKDALRAAAKNAAAKRTKRE